MNCILPFRIQIGGKQHQLTSYANLFKFNSQRFQQKFPRQYSIPVMAVTKEQVESSLTSKLTPSHLVVIDTSGGCGASYMVEIVSEQFQGKRLLERHRMVNGALTEEMKEIHALSITKALTPDQWKQQQESGKSQAAT